MKNVSVGFRRFSSGRASPRKLGWEFLWNLSCSCRMAYFIRDEIEEGENKKSIAGRDALGRRWGKVMVDDGKKVKSYDELNVFQIYSFLLSPPQRSLLEVATKRLLNVSSAAAAASSSSGSVPSSSKNAKKKKRENEHDDMVAAKNIFK